MPADALNLINHMKLHVNGKMAERQKEREIEREKDRKKKDQESAEAISGLKNKLLISSLSAGNMNPPYVPNYVIRKYTITMYIECFF